jgi:hypothetical protein
MNIKMAEHVENLPWVIVAIGMLMGGPIMLVGFRKAREKPAPRQINRTVRQDWAPTGNIDFHTSSAESSSPQPLRLWVEENKITESVVGQRIVELRWRPATIEEGKKLVVCWKARQTQPATLLPRPCLVDE